MSLLLEEMPSSVEQTLQAHRNGTGDTPMSLVIKADLLPNGQIGERWVAIDPQMVRVLSSEASQASASQVEIALPFPEIASAETENLVGGGALIAITKSGERIELARFTTLLAGRMAGTARFVTALAKEEEPPTLAELEDQERLCPNCGRPLPEDNDVCRFCINKTATLGRLLAYAAPLKWQAVLLVMLMFAGTAAGLVPGLIILRLTDDVLIPQTPVSRDQRLVLLGWLVVALAVSQLLTTGIGVWRGRLSAYLSGTITYRIRTQLYERLQWLGLSFYDKRQSGALMTRVTQDVNELNNFLVDGLQILVVNGLTLLGIVIVLFLQNWRLTLLVLIPIPFVILSTRTIWKFLRRRFQRLWALRSSMNAGLNSTLTGARVVKAFAQEDREITRFNRRALNLTEAQMSVEQWWATLFPLIGLIMTSGQFIVWYVGGRQVIGEVITFGILNMFLYYLTRLYEPLQGMTRIADWLSRAVTAAERVFEVVDTDPDVKDVPEAVAMPDIKGAVTFENVSFGYEKGRRVVENVNLTVAPGEMIGLVGHSGAGKTTIINLISRFYDPTEGMVTIDGVDMKQVRVSDLRGQLGIVLQEPFLFPGTITDNITYAKPDASPEEIIRAAKAANAHDFIMRFPDGYDTQVGERGVKLSGGERQRLSIARAILHDPRILILDEATASVDTETEKQIQEAIARLIKGRTTFAIAHRLSTLRNADRLVVMDKGKIAEMGTHEELMEKENGTFRRLVEMQTEINKLRSDTVALED
ncbi:MAG: ABC transporter ATP-binding protein [Cytophagales bacterium]|nr:ABC transporter ATP-binding protein [Armatimonadota bacterium]